jgi:lipopolysaccharide export LptBFGC system permease protein LptF
MILRPVQEHGVGPQQVFHLIGYFLPITLTFVLPIAALFAASLVYGRFAADNELDACRASGIGLKSLVYPGLALAIMIAIANLVLSFYVTPAFVQRAEKAIKADAQKIIFRNIQRRGYYQSPDGRWQIYADLVDSKKKVLSGVVIVELNGPKIDRIITSDDAYVQFNPERRFNEVQITAYNTYIVDYKNEDSFFNERTSFTKGFPPLLGDDIKFKKIDKIKQIRANYMLFNPVAKLAYAAYAQFSTELLANDIARKINNREDEFYMLHSGEKIVRFTADRCAVSDERQIELGGRVIVEEYDDLSGTVPVRTLQCSKALLNIRGDEDLLTLTFAFYNAHWRTSDGSAGTAGRPIVIRGLIIPAAITKITDQKGSVLEAVSGPYIEQSLKQQPGPQLLQLEDKLENKIRKTAVQITAEIHSRLSFGIGCIPLIMIGIGLGIIKKGGHLLSAFGASSIPAAVLIVCIISGKNIIENLGSLPKTGMTLIWAGPVLLVLLVAVIYHGLLKH